MNSGETPNNLDRLLIHIACTPLNRFTLLVPLKIENYLIDKFAAAAKKNPECFEVLKALLEDCTKREEREHGAGKS